MRLLRRRWAWLSETARRRPFLTAFLAMTVLVAGGFYRTQQLADRQAATSKQQAQDNADRIEADAEIIHALHADLRCIEKWANSTVDRSQELQPLAVARIEDLFEAFRVALFKGQQDKAQRLAKRAIREDARYLRELKLLPIPELRLHCRLLISDPPKPKPRPTVTVTRPAPLPPTVTAFAPGPTVTRTRTVYRTRTATVTVAPGRQKTRTVVASCELAVGGKCVTLAPLATTSPAPRGKDHR